MGQGWNVNKKRGLCKGRIGAQQSIGVHRVESCEVECGKRSVYIGAGWIVNQESGI